MTSDQKIRNSLQYAMNRDTREICIFKMWETKPGYAGLNYPHSWLHKMNYKKYCMMQILTVDQWDLKRRSRVRHGNDEMKWWISREKRQTVGSVWCGCCWFRTYSIYSMHKCLWEIYVHAFLFCSAWVLGSPNTESSPIDQNVSGEWKWIEGI